MVWKLGYTVDFYLSVKKNEIMKCLVKWVELEHIPLREVTQSQEENIVCFLSHADSEF